jgi:hypothetical protein
MWLLCQGNEQKCQPFLVNVFWLLLSVSSNLAKQHGPHFRSHKFLASHQQINCMVSDNNGAHNLSWKKKKPSTLSKSDPVAVSYSICWNYCTFSFFGGVLWVNGVLFCPFQWDWEMSLLVFFTLIIGGSLALMYLWFMHSTQYIAILDLWAFMSINHRIFFSSNFVISNTLQKNYEGLAKFPLTKFANWLVLINVKIVG